MIKNANEIKEAARIVEIISEYLPLKKSGSNYTAKCPFHDENTASFFVNENKGIFHCFGCNESGDVISFLQKYKKIDFNQALREIANKYNIAIIDDFKGSPIKAYYEVLKKVNSIFINALESETQVLKYLYNRGLSDEFIMKFDIGFIKKDFFKSLRNDEIILLLELGLLVKKGSDIYTPFANRISLALRDFYYRVIGFSSRTHPYYDFRKTAKYINSKESLVFHKSKVLYGLSQAKETIIKLNKVYIVEGFFDCIALHKQGIINTVALCGSAFNLTHLSQLFKLSDTLEIILCFDKDEAGHKATMNSSLFLINQKCYNFKIALIENQVKDLGEVMQKGDAIHLKLKNGFVYYYMSLMNTADFKQKDKILNSIKSVINNESNFYTKQFLNKSIITALNLPQDFFNANIHIKLLDKYSLEKALLKSMMNDKYTFDLCIDYLEDVHFGSFRDDYKALCEGKITQNLQAFNMDDRIKIISYEYIAENIKTLAKRYIKDNLKTLDTQQLLRLHKKFI